MSATLATRTTVFSCRPSAAVPVDGDAGDLLDDVLTALEANPRVLGAGGVGYDYETNRVESTFQVSPWPTDGEHLAFGLPETAAAIAIEIFNDALEAAGRTERVTTLAIVAGDDPELLP